MSVIENFAELSEQEQRAFAEALMKTINSEHTFTSESDFKVTSIEADDMSGGLFIEVTNTEPIEVGCKATWQAADEDDAYSEPDDINVKYEIDVYDAVESTFKTKEAVIEGYEVSLHEVYDVDEKFVDVEIDDISDEDSGIGSYEYFGFTGYDSNEYVEAKGTILYECTCMIIFSVEPADEPVSTGSEENEED